MKRLLLFLSIFTIAYVLSSISSATSIPVATDVRMQFGFFYSSLAPHGEWIEVESRIRVWRPFHISHQWHPYLVGRWVWTDVGWYWMSKEPFGWITYHYGRWYYDDYYGWVWLPDDVWAPAWVEWRYDDNFIGWAPLPPYATFNTSVGIRFTTHWRAPAYYWNFVRYHRFGSELRFRDIAPEEYAKRLVHTSHSGRQYGIDHDRIINRGIDRSIIERRGNIRFTQTDVIDIRERTGERMARSIDNQRIEIYRPTRDEMQRTTGRVEARRGEHNLSIDMTKVERSRGTPQVQERPSRFDRQQMRRELIQRHERNLRPSPPAVRDGRRQRIGQRRENSQITQPDRPTPGERSGDRRTR